MEKRFSYKVLIEPVGSFFFGGERNFYDDIRNRTNYLVHSLPIPQQTTVLGMLRYALRGSLLSCENEKLTLEQLIGKHGFCGKDEPIGIIEKISPVFLQKQETLYYEAGMDYQIGTDAPDLESNSKPGFVKYTNTEVRGKCVLDKPLKYIPFLSEYDLKKDHRHHLVSQFSNEIINYDQVFKKCEQVGNLKNCDDAENEGFYKEFRYRLINDFRFCFFLETSEKLRSVPTAFLAFMGGEQSEFKITVKSDAFSWGEEEGTGKQGRIVLQSDAFLTSEILATCDFAILESTNFRYIRTNLQMKNYALINHVQNNEIPSKSSNIKLAGRGSVLYCRDLEAFKQKMSDSVFRRIGYNYFQIKDVSYEK